MSAKTKTAATIAAIAVLLTAGILIGRASNENSQDQILVTDVNPPVTPPDVTADETDTDLDNDKPRRSRNSQRRGPANADSDEILASDEPADDQGRRIQRPTKRNGIRRGQDKAKRRGDRDSEPGDDTPEPTEQRRGGAAGIVDT